MQSLIEGAQWSVMAAVLTPPVPPDLVHLATAKLLILLVNADYTTHTSAEPFTLSVISLSDGQWRNILVCHTAALASQTGIVSGGSGSGGSGCLGSLKPQVSSDPLQGGWRWQAV